MKTAVLYICHVINDETLFRYHHMKQATDKLGYDLFWCIDNDSYKNPQYVDINFYYFTLNRFFTEMPKYAVTKKNYPNWIDDRINLPTAPILLFYKDHKDQYDQTWHFEFDACFCGDWCNWFNKYNEDVSDLIVVDQLNYENGQQNWWNWKCQSQEVMRKINETGGGLCWSLFCAARMSNHLMHSILEFADEFNDGSFYLEWWWITTARRYNYPILTFRHTTNYWEVRPTIPSNFTGFRENTIYHAVKLDVKWRQVLEKYCPQYLISANI